MSDRVSSTDDQSTPASSLDETIEAFETAWNHSGFAEVKAFLPSRSHPDYESIVAELLSVDLERRWKCGGERRTVEDYRRQFPELTARKQVLERLAFEEYRLTCTSGSMVSPDDYGRRYHVRTDHWPRLSRQLEQAEVVARGALADGVADEMERLSAVTHPLPAVGDRFLSFEIIEHLGQCKFGNVYLASQRDLANRLVVIKVTTNLWSESDRLARLQHTNIVPIYSVHQDGGLQAVCMPYLGRHTLETLVQERRERPDITVADMLDSLLGSGDPTTMGTAPAKFPGRQLEFLTSLSYEQFCTWIAARTAAGLTHAHERGILHRDLKPANILLTDDLRPMILDFNLSEDVVAGGRSTLLIGGTLPYMAPEHLRAVIADGDVDQRSDIYSLGVMLFQLLTGQLPFPEMPGSIIGSLSYLINDRCNAAPSPRAVNPRISRDIDSIVIRCLAAEASQRYQSARELREDLEAHLHDNPLQHAANRSTRERMKKWCRRHPRVSSSTAVLALASIVLAVALGFLFVRSERLAHLESITVYRQYRAQSQAAFAPLSSVIVDPEIIRDGLDEAAAALSLYSLDKPDWIRKPNFRYLDRRRQTALMNDIQTLQFLQADAVHRLALQEQDRERKRDLLALALRHNESARVANADGSHVSQAILLQQADLEAKLGREGLSDNTRQVANELAVEDTSSRLAVEDTSSRLMFAVKKLGTREYEAAETLLNALQDELPQDFVVWFLLGNCNYASGRFAEADACFSSCAVLRPDFYFTFFQRGVCRLKAKRFDAAERDFCRVLERLPDNTSALANRALVRIELHRLRDAAEDLTRAIDHGRNDCLMHLLRSRVWKALGKLDEARCDLELGKSLTPVCVDGWIQRASVFRPSDPLAALRDVDAALELAPTSRKALRNKASILSQLNRNEEAVAVLSLLIDAYPDDATALLGRGLIRARLAERDAAIADGVRGVELDNSAQQHYQMARLLAQTSLRTREDADLAVNYLRKALQGKSELVRLTEHDPDLKPILHRREVRLLLAAASELQAVAPTSQ